VEAQLRFGDLPLVGVIIDVVAVVVVVVASCHFDERNFCSLLNASLFCTMYRTVFSSFGLATRALQNPQSQTSQKEKHENGQ